MLVRTIPLSSGTAHIYGYDISDPTDMNSLRSMFGICSQQDILFDDLNAEDHKRRYSTYDSDSIKVEPIISSSSHLESGFIKSFEDIKFEKDLSHLKMKNYKFHSSIGIKT